MNVAYFILISLWAFYFFLHSFLASLWFKNKIRIRFGKYFRYYRIVFNLVAILGLVAIIVYSAFIPSNFIFNKNSVTTFVGLVMATWGIIIIRLSFKNYNLKEFLGLNEERSPLLKMSGLLQHVRHPMYSGIILLTIGFWLFAPTLANLISVLSINIYLLIGIQLEEAKLIKEFGQEYIDYKKKVPMLIPYLKF